MNFFCELLCLTNFILLLIIFVKFVMFSVYFNKVKLTELLTTAEKDEPLSPLNIYRKMLGKAILLRYTLSLIYIRLFSIIFSNCTVVIGHYMGSVLSMLLPSIAHCIVSFFPRLLDRQSF